jgi:hypothetical protein
MSATKYTFNGSWRQVWASNKDEAVFVLNRELNEHCYLCRHMEFGYNYPQKYSASVTAIRMHIWPDGLHMSEAEEQF